MAFSLSWIRYSSPSVASPSKTHANRRRMSSVVAIESTHLQFLNCRESQEIAS